MAPRKRQVFAVLEARQGLGFRTTSTRALEPNRRGRFTLRFRPEGAGELRVTSWAPTGGLCGLTTRRRLSEVR